MAGRCAVCPRGQAAPQRTARLPSKALQVRSANEKKVRAKQLRTKSAMASGGNNCLEINDILTWAAI